MKYPYKIFGLIALLSLVAVVLGCGQPSEAPAASTTTTVRTSTTLPSSTTTFPGTLTSTTATTVTTVFSFVTGTGLYTVTDPAKPAKGASITDANFHATLTRITRKSLDGYSDPGIENEYAKADPENCDGTDLILRGNDGEWYLYDAATYQMVKHLSAIVGGGEEPEPRWDPTDPKIFYSPYGMELKQYNIDSDAFTTVHDFSADFPTASYITTKTEGDASLNRRYWCFMVEDSGMNVLAVICYDKKSDTIVGTRTSFPDSINWVGMDMSGQHCVIGYDTSTTEVCPRDFSSAAGLPDGAVGHMDLALMAAGKDAMVYQNNATDWISLVELDAPSSETKLVKIPFNVNTDIGLHFSGNCARTPGWALVSTCGSKNPQSGKSHSWMDNQLFMVELKASPRIWRIASTHCYLWLDDPPPATPTIESTYYYESYATINTAGTRIYFGSNWGQGINDNYSVPVANNTDAYKVTLPNAWNSLIP